MKMTKEEAFRFVLSKVADAQKAGGKCLWETKCCLCLHKPCSVCVEEMATLTAFSICPECSCKCPDCRKYKCLSCSLPGNTSEFCTWVKKLVMMEL